MKPKMLFITGSILLVNSLVHGSGIYYEEKDGTVDDGVSSTSYPLTPKFLTWTKNANPANKRMSYRQAEEYISKMNSGEVENFGYTDWKIPTKEEMDHHIGVKFKFIGKPETLNKLPQYHPFTNFNKNNQYWMQNLLGSIDPTMIWTNDRYLWPVRVSCTGDNC
jgi:hypothetical protein